MGTAVLKIKKGGGYKLLFLLRRDGFLRGSKGGTPACLNLHKGQAIFILGYNINFSIRAAKVSIQNVAALLSEIFLGQSFP
jgi:hypothetical protein